MLLFVFLFQSTSLHSSTFHFVHVHLDRSHGNNPMGGSHPMGQTHTHMKPIDGSMVSLVDVLFSSALWAPCLSLLIGVL